MKVVHSFGESKVGRNIREDAGFILTNKIGGYCYFTSKPASRYQGVFFNENFRMYKVIEELKLANAPSVRELKNNFFNFERKRRKVIENFFIPFHYNSLVYELNKEKEIEIILDVRESYKNPEFGRYYEISEEKGKIIIKYKQENEFECYLVINKNEYKKTCNWFLQDYPADRERNSFPDQLYVFSALKIRARRLVFSFSFDKKKAIQENDYVLKNLKKLRDAQKENLKRIFVNAPKIRDTETKLAYLCALNSLNDLTVSINNVPGIYAGLPWFFQFWVRDNAISLKALSLIEKGASEKILMRLLDRIKSNGKTLNKYPVGDSHSADAPGWIVKRGYELDKEKLKQKIENLKNIKSFAASSETWMDSLNRGGDRIELRAVSLNVYHVLFNLTKNKKYMNLGNKLKAETKKEFLVNGMLKDGINDETIRPNIFIAAYVYPELLTRGEWTTCFQNALNRLWLLWGGLSTVDRNNPLFCGKHTGENPMSYHNGDSWFYLNNLAALVLHKINSKKFRQYINRILNASVNEILWKGAVGSHAELSSADKPDSEGCPAQAWSAAMFIELVDELSKN